jgi:hypothetical protein
MTDKQIKTRIKLLPTLLKIFVGVGGLFMLTTAADFTIKFLSEPTAFNFVSVLMFSFMGFFFIGIGPATIATYSVDGQTLTENILGLIKKRIELREIESYALRQAGNRYRTSDQLVLNKKDGQTIFIDSFGLRDFKEFRLKIENLLPYDFKTKPNYWTKFYKVSVIWLCIWVGLMIIFIVIGK